MDTPDAAADAMPNPFPVELAQGTLERAKKLKIYAEDIDEQFIRGTGAGGQKINKTNSCVQLRHLPTGTEVKIQEHREREANRKTAYRTLIEKVEEAALGKASKLAQKRHKIRKQKQRRSRRSKEKILQDKAYRSQIKKTRKSVDPGI